MPCMTSVVELVRCSGSVSRTGRSFEALAMAKIENVASNFAIIFANILGNLDGYQIIFDYALKESGTSPKTIFILHQEKTMLLLVLSCIAFLVAIASMCTLVIFLRRKKETSDTSSASSDDASASSDDASTGSETGGDWKTTAITFYGQSKADDNGTGFAGVDLFRHGEAGLTFNGKPLFPVAIFQGSAAGMLWKIIEVKSNAFTNNKTMYGHVVDVCNSGQDVCKTNSSKHGKYLVDIHKTAFTYVGLDDGLHKGEYRKVGELRPSKISQNIWLKDGTVACSCTGGCKGNDVKWIKHSKC